MGTVGVVGLGYVGLPLAVHFADKGFRVVAYDIDELKIASLIEMSSYVEDVTDDQLKSASENIHATSDVSMLAKADCISVCVPTPATGSVPDLRPIMSALESIAPHVKPESVIVIESTVYPNFTKEKAAPLFPHAHVVFSPERVDPCNSDYSIGNIPKVMGADSPAALSKASKFYSELFTLKEVSSTSVAEASKLLENTYRAVNIALANEMARICGDLGINVWDVIDAAKSKPFGFQAFWPSLGVGGHCIPVDPYYLLHKGESSFIRSAMEINSASVIRCLSIADKDIVGNVLVVGVAYKPDISDCRESPALDLMCKIRDIDDGRSVDVRYFDPYVVCVRLGDRTQESMSSLNQAVEWADCVLICVDHSGLDTNVILDSNSPTYDFCGMFKGSAGISGI